MRKIFLFLFVSLSLQSFAQTNYTKFKGRYGWYAGIFDSTLHLPSGASPSLRTGGYTGLGAIFYKTSDSSLYHYTGYQWLRNINPNDTVSLSNRINRKVDTIYRDAGTDSIKFKINGTTYSIKDSTQGNATSGTYVPDTTGGLVSNISSATAYQAQWMRIGNIVHLSGKINIDPISAGTVTELDISTPINSAFDHDYQCSGVISAMVGSTSGKVYASTSNKIRIYFKSSSTIAEDIYFTATYQIIYP